MNTRMIPILFKTPMVQAILNTTPDFLPIDPDKPFKWQTRRVMKKQPPEWVTQFGYTFFTPDGSISGRGCHEDDGPAEMFFKLRYQRGDILWVKETWGVAPSLDDSFNAVLKDKRLPDKLLLRPASKWAEWILYRADGHLFDRDQRWRPFIFMPRWACRLFLEVTDVRVQRVQDISEEDAQAEGVAGSDGAWRCYGDCPEHKDGRIHRSSATASFMSLWNSINAKPKPVHRTIDGRKQIDHYVSYPWEAGTYTDEYRGKPHHVFGNPAVWAASFNRLTDIPVQEGE